MAQKKRRNVGRKISGKMPRGADFGDLLESTLRRDPEVAAAGEKQRRAAEIQAFLGGLEAKNAAGGGGFNAALLDLPSAGFLKTAGKSLINKELGKAALNATAFTGGYSGEELGSAPGDAAAALQMFSGMPKAGLERAFEFLRRSNADQVGSAAMALASRGAAERRNGVTEEEAAFPVFGSKTGRLSRAAQQMKKKGKDLPQFSAEGQIAPARQRELETQMREMIPLMGAKDPAKVAADLDAWVKSNPFWGKYPLQKEPLLDLMPASLRAPLYQSLKNMGYGGVKMGSREFGSRRPDYRPGKETITPGADRKWEDILKYEQGGGIPAGWAERNPGKKPQRVFRPGESPEPGEIPFGGDLFKTTAGAGLLGAALAGQGTESDDSQAGLVLSRRNLGELRRQYLANLASLDKARPGFSQTNSGEAFVKAKYPKLYAKLTKDSPVKLEPSFDSFAGEFNPWSGIAKITALPDRMIRKDRLRDAGAASADIIAHESLHSADFNRIFHGLKSPDGRALALADLTPDDLNTRDMKKLYRRLGEVPSRNLKKLDEIPDVSGKYSAEGDLDVYKNQPFEQRAFGAGDRAASSYLKFLDMLENSKTTAAGSRTGLSIDDLLSAFSNEPR